MKLIRLISTLITLLLFLGTLTCIPIHRHLTLNGVTFDSDRVDTLLSVGEGDAMYLPILFIEWAILFVIWEAIWLLTSKKF